MKTTTTLREWRLLEGYTYKRLGEAIGVTEESARRLCLPDDHPLNRFPSRDDLRAIYKLTAGAVDANSFVEW